MKKIVSLVLVLAICLSLCACEKSDTCPYDCDQCAEYEKQAQAAETAGPTNATCDAETVEQNDNAIEFETPIVVAEDENLRVEVVKFYEEYRLWKKGYPYNADAATEGATLEKLVVFKLCNKTDHTLTTYLNDTYLGSDGAAYFDIDGASRIDTAAGKNVLRTFLIQTGANTALGSMEELYSLDGDFSIFHKGEDGVMRNNYRLKFSIPNGMSGNSANSASGTVSLEKSSYLGKWQVTEITFADENISSRMEEDAALWENYFKGMLGSFENVYFVFTESGDCYYLFQGDTTASRWEMTETGVKTKGIVFVADGDKLVCERDGYLLYWEKVSDSQAIPET